MNIKRENYNLLLHPSKIIKELDRKNLHKDIDGYLIEMYMDDLSMRFNKHEIKLMIESIEDDNVVKSGRESEFIGLLGVIIALQTLTITTLINATNNPLFKTTLSFLSMIYLGILFIPLIYYFIRKNIIAARRSKTLHIMKLYLKSIETNE